MTPVFTPDDALPPVSPWLPPLVRAAAPESANFLGHCHAAIDTARRLIRMRQETPRLRGSLHDVGSYLTELADLTEIELDPVLAWADLRLGRDADARFGAAWGRVAGALHLGYLEAAVRLRLTVAREVDQDLWPVLARARDAAPEPAALLADCTAFLDEAEPHWSDDARGRLAAGECAFRKAFAEATGDAP